MKNIYYDYNHLLQLISGRDKLLTYHFTAILILVNVLDLSFWKLGLKQLGLSYIWGRDKKKKKINNK